MDRMNMTPLTNTHWALRAAAFAPQGTRFTFTNNPGEGNRVRFDPPGAAPEISPGKATNELRRLGWRAGPVRWGPEEAAIFRRLEAMHEFLLARLAEDPFTASQRPWLRRVTEWVATGPDDPTEALLSIYALREEIGDLPLPPGGIWKRCGQVAHQPAWTLRAETYRDATWAEAAFRRLDPELRRAYGEAA